MGEFLFEDCDLLRYKVGYCNPRQTCVTVVHMYVVAVVLFEPVLFFCCEESKMYECILLICVYIHAYFIYNSYILPRCAVADIKR